MALLKVNRASGAAQQSQGRGNLGALVGNSSAVTGVTSRTVAEDVANPVQTLVEGEIQATNTISSALTGAAQQIGQAVERKNQLNEMSDRSEMKAYMSGVAVATSSSNKKAQRAARRDGFTMTLDDLKLNSQNTMKDLLAKTKPNYSSEKVNGELEKSLQTLATSNDLDLDIGESSEKYQIDAMTFKTAKRYDDLAQLVKSSDVGSLEYASLQEEARLNLTSPKQIALMGEAVAYGTSVEKSEQLAEAWVAGRIALNDPQDLEETLAVIDSDDNLDRDVRDVLIGKVDEQVRINSQQDITDLKNEVSETVLSDDPELMDILAEEVQDPESRFSGLPATSREAMFKKLNANMGTVSRTVKDQTSRAEITLGVLNGDSLTLTDVDTKLARQGFDELPTEIQDEAAVKYAESGFLPGQQYLTQLSNEALVARTEGELGLGEESARKLSQLIVTNPKVAAELDPQALNVANYFNQGMTLLDAQKAAKDVAERKPETVARLKRQWSSLSRRPQGKPSQMDGMIRGIVGDAFDSGVSGEVEDELNAVAASIYNRTGSTAAIETQLLEEAKFVSKDHNGNLALYAPSSYSQGDPRLKEAIENDRSESVAAVLAGLGIPVDTPVEMTPIASSIGSSQPKFYIEIDGVPLLDTDGSVVNYGITPADMINDINVQVKGAQEAVERRSRMEASSARMEAQIELLQQDEPRSNRRSRRKGTSKAEKFELQESIEARTRELTTVDTTRVEAKAQALAEVLGQEERIKSQISPIQPTSQFGNVDSTMLEGFEGRRVEAYDDTTRKTITLAEMSSTKRPTIGVGHLITQGEQDQGYIRIGTQNVPIGQKLSNNQIDKLLSQDTGRARNQIDKEIKIKVSKKQYESLISLYLNLGSLIKQAPKALNALNAGDIDEFGLQINEVIYSDGVASEGLAKRRAAEFLHGWGEL